MSIVLHMSDLGANAASGFQAFLEFDEDELTFVQGVYTAAPFGLHILNPIQAIGGTIDIAAGINQFGGQTPTLNDSDLVTLTFITNQGACIESLAFRPHSPPSRISDANGQEIEPLQLIAPGDIPPSADINADGVVNVSDLLILLSLWGTDDCRADFNNDGTVNVSDLLILFANWG